MLESPSEIVTITASDGTALAARIYKPAGNGPFPTLFAASPYRFDNDDIPETNTFLWRETGPIDWYVERGYAYVHMDVRGTGRSGGDYGFYDRRERRDLYDAIEWIAAQPWSNGKVGGIGHSYYATSQWCMASERPPHLACIAPYDGHCDLYRGWACHAGVPSHFLREWWDGNVRWVNMYPFTKGAPRRDLQRDLSHDIFAHPDFDAFWQERDFAGKLDGCTIPLLSIGAWAKYELHTAGNLEGFSRFEGDKWLLMTGAPHMSAVQADFETAAFHEKYLLAFYDTYLKGVDGGMRDRPRISLAVRQAEEPLLPPAWPPAAKHVELPLSDTPSGAVRSLNDGSLGKPAQAGSTSYTYPDPLWALGNIELTPQGPNPVSRNLTFTSAPLAQDLQIAGYPELVLFLSSTRDDADVIVKLVEQFPAAGGQPPRSIVVTKGWLRASHRAVLDRHFGVRHDSRAPEPIVPGQVYELAVGLMPMSYRFSAGSRLRLDVSCADSPITDTVFHHAYTPDKVGTDTLHHSAQHPSRLILPVVAGTATFS